MTVQELIDELMLLKNKDKEIVFNDYNDKDHGIYYTGYDIEEENYYLT